MVKIGLIAATAFLGVTSALAGETFFHSPSGAYQGSASTLSNGDTFFYDANGAYQGSATVLSNGDAFFHDANGAYQGSATHLGD